MELKDLAQKVKERLEKKVFGTVDFKDTSGIYGESYEISYLLKSHRTHGNNVARELAIIELKIGTSWFFSNALGVIIVVTGKRTEGSPWLLNQRRYIEFTGNYLNVFSWIMDLVNNRTIGVWKQRDSFQDSVVHYINNIISVGEIHSFLKYGRSKEGSEKNNIFSPNTTYNISLDSEQSPFSSKICEIKLPHFDKTFLSKEELYLVIQIRYYDSESIPVYYYTWKKMIDKPVRDLVEIRDEIKLDGKNLQENLKEVFNSWLKQELNELLMNSKNLLPDEVNLLKEIKENMETE